MNNIRTKRRELNMTMKQLAAIVGVTEAAISHYETGRREPDPDMLNRIATALGVTVDYLIGRDNTESEKQKQTPAERRAEAKQLIESMDEEQYQAAVKFLRFLKGGKE